MPSTPELGDLLQAAAQQAQFELHTAMPGQITAIYDDGQTKRQFADVRPCLRRALPTEEDAPQPLAEEELPILPRVPIGYVQGGGWFISVPLKVGDFVTVIFAERSIDRWLATARKSSQAAVSTGDLGMHTLDGAIALPLGPAPIGELLEGVSATQLVIGKSGGGILISLSDTLVQLGATSGTDFVALSGKVNTENNSWKSDIDTLKAATSTGLGTIPTVGGTTKSAFDLATAAIPHTPASTAASKVKAI
jgi:hypothetical protein